ncbi:hypothetical protein GGF41_000818 [Coemansia sp. RSA 2531]|nr:hypothetical protein GGF41_000818 [Coemansia sp. RSA 2531]
MPSLSPLQTLPLHAVEMIVDHVAINIRQTFDIANPAMLFEKYHIFQMPLLWVCHIFRTAVYSRFSARYGLWFYKDTIVECTIPCTRCQKRLDGPFRLMAKEIAITIDPCDIYSGKALAELSQVPYNECSLPLARKLEIYFIDNRNNEEGSDVPPDAKDNISAFVRRIRQMAPRLNMVKMQDISGLGLQTTATALYFDCLITQLVQISSRIDIASGLTFGRAIHLLNVDAIRNLTFFCTSFDLISGRTVRLIRLNAPTLQCLRVSSHGCIDLSGIIRDVDGSYVEYPHLHTFVAKLNTSQSVPGRYTFDGAVPFPYLRRLVCGGDYPFGDDLVLFRGNAATLELLQLTLTRKLAVTLLRSKVFTPTSHPKLQCVIFEMPPSVLQFNFADDPKIIQFMLDIAPDAAVRKISNWYLDQVPPPVLSLFSRHASIQVLSLPGLRLSLWGAMTLIQSLPLLSDLHAQAPTLDPMPAGVTVRNVVTYVRSNYSPIDTRFRCWHFGGGGSRLMKDKVKPFLLLALACPNFDYAAAVHYEREEFAKRLEKTIGTAAYKKYAPRLRRLLPYRPK